MAYCIFGRLAEIIVHNKSVMQCRVILCKRTTVSPGSQTDREKPSAIFKEVNTHILSKEMKKEIVAWFYDVCVAYVIIINCCRCFGHITNTKYLFGKIEMAILVIFVGDDDVAAQLVYSL